jgi:hypothetical protein
MHHTMLSEQGQAGVPAPKQPWDKQLIGLLASLLCLAGAVYVLWTTGNVVMFLLLIGVATGQVPLWRTIGRLGLLGGPAKPYEGETRTEELW